MQRSRWFTPIAAIAVAAYVLPMPVHAATAWVEQPSTHLGPALYPGNRPPLLPTPFLKLPLKAVRPQGWLRKQLELQADGFHGHLTEISQFLKTEGNAWLNPKGEGQHGWEEVPYWLKGFTDCAYLLQREDQIREAHRWLEAALASQQTNGLFGPRPGTQSTVDSTQGRYDLWPNMVMLHCLQSYYDATDDPRVLQLMTKYFAWQLTVPEEDFLPPYWQKIRAADNLWSVHWLYHRTGESWLLELAERIHRHTANFTDGLPDWHNVNLSQAFGGPTFFYPQSKDPRHLAASERNWQTLRSLYGQVPGGMFGGDENCRPGFADPRQAVETCGMVEMMFSHERLLLVTGNPVWADRCEDVTFNSLPAALTADFKALRYLTAPNLIRSDRHNKAPGYQNGGAMLHFNPHSHRCCQHNFGHGWPYFAEHTWVATADRGLAAVLYAPTEVTARISTRDRVTIREVTQYPFEDTVSFRVQVTMPTTFPLYLRVPGWCDDPQVFIDGKRQRIRGSRAGYLRIERTWQSGDTLRLVLPMRVAVRTWAANHNSVSIDRGPLTYSLRIGEQVIREGGTDRWPAFEIHPTTPWNYGLELRADDPTRDIQFVRKPWPASDLPFTPEDCPVALNVRARRLPEWQEDHLGLVGLLQPSPAYSTQPLETVPLLPMGAARLRIAAFPTTSPLPAAHAWKGPPPSLPYRVSASHCHETDSPGALKDQILPTRSDDRSIPRFTWWDHKGTTEWVQYDFDRPRSVSRVEVYWFDDTPAGGCGLPASWRVLYQKDGAWLPVGNPEADPPAPDKLNAMSFEAVETSALRLEVQLHPNLSAGILEWQVP